MERPAPFITTLRPFSAGKAKGGHEGVPRVTPDLQINSKRAKGKTAVVLCSLREDINLVCFLKRTLEMSFLILQHVAATEQGAGPPCRVGLGLRPVTSCKQCPLGSPFRSRWGEGLEAPGWRRSHPPTVPAAPIGETLREESRCRNKTQEHQVSSLESRERGTALMLSTGSLFVKTLALRERAAGSQVGEKQGAGGSRQRTQAVGTRGQKVLSRRVRGQRTRLQNRHSVSCRGLKHQGTPWMLESKQQPRLVHCSELISG